MSEYIVVNNQIIKLSDIKKITADKKRLSIIFNMGPWDTGVTKKFTDSDHFKKAFEELVTRLDAWRI